MATTQRLTVTSSALSDGQTLPQSMVFNGAGLSGGNTSPDLQWSGAPSGTKSYAVTVYDPDAPTTVGFVHWVLFNIPASVTKLEAGAGAKKDAGVGATHGHNDYGFAGFGGAAPPPGDPPHHYHLAVYALDLDRLDLDETTTYAKLRFTIRGHVLAIGELVGTFGRD
jgi:Raf kinase inhibitor-like YbhB/YbcL family protein